MIARARRFPSELFPSALARAGSPTTRLWLPTQCLRHPTTGRLDHAGSRIAPQHTSRNRNRRPKLVCCLSVCIQQRIAINDQARRFRAAGSGTGQMAVFFRETSTPERCFPSRDRWPLQPRRQLDRRCSPAALHIRQVWRGASLCARRVGQVARLSSRSPEWFQLMCFGSGYRQRPTRPPTQHRRHVPPSGHQETSWVQPKCRAGMWRGVPRLPDGANQS